MASKRNPSKSREPVGTAAANRSAVRHARFIHSVPDKRELS